MQITVLQIKRSEEFRPAPLTEFDVIRMVHNTAGIGVFIINAVTDFVRHIIHRRALTGRFDLASSQDNGTPLPIIPAPVEFVEQAPAEAEMAQRHPL